MKKLFLLALVACLGACATHSNSASETASTSARTPTSVEDLTGHYLGEGLFSKRTGGLDRPAMRFYLERVAGEADSYYGVLVEYDQLMAMAAPYLASQKAPPLNKVVGYLDKIATRISAYKLTPGQARNTYEMYNLEVRNGRIVPASNFQMVLNLASDSDKQDPLGGAMITGNEDGQIVFPKKTEAMTKNAFQRAIDALIITQYDLAKFAYKIGRLSSTWRGNWEDLEGSYLSEYGRLEDGVLELSTQNGQKQMQFIKSNRTKAKHFTNPKSAAIEGTFIVSEPIPKMYVLTPARGTNSASDKEMTGRIGLFLDVFDASAPEAGSHLVTELAFTNPRDPEDFMMYYEHPEHLKNVGVLPPKK